MEKFIVPLSEDEELIRELIEPLLVDEGFELVAIHFGRSKSKGILTLFLDKDGDNGISISEIESMSKYLGRILDVKGDGFKPLRGAYELTVSSPGLDRPLSKISHFKNSIGKKIRVRIKASLSAASKTVTGFLKAVSDEVISLDKENKGLESEYLNILFSDIDKACEVFVFEKPSKKKLN